MRHESKNSQRSTFLEPPFLTISVALIAILAFLIIYVIKVEQRFSQNATKTELWDSLEKATEDIKQEVSRQLSETAKQLADEEAEQSAQLADLTKRIDTLTQQAQTLHSLRIKDMQEQTDALSKQIESIQEQLKLEGERRRREPGRRFRDCPVCPEMVVVPWGDFEMGSPSDEIQRDNDEALPHQVGIIEPFAVGVFEVTFQEWDACVKGGGCKDRPRDMGWGRGDRPVITVSWHDARAYVEWLSEKTQHHYRLLSEAEWEYVARAGTTGPFHTGSTISTDQANYDGNRVYGPGDKGEFRRQTLPVGSFAPNAFGLHDVHGNVWEWVHDCWHDHYSNTPDDGRARERDEDCSQGVVRGGSWMREPQYLRSANRMSRPATFHSQDIGFRVARTFGP